MTESQSPQDGSFAAPRNGVPAGTEPYSGSYLDSTADYAAGTSAATSTDQQGQDPYDAAGAGHRAASGKGTPSTEDVKHEAADVADTARAAAGDVVDTAKDEAANVAHEVKLNARQLLNQTKGELTEQAATQQQRVAEGLRSISDELSTMANASTDGGVATDLVHQAAERSSSVAHWLENRDPGSLLDEVKSFARRKPGAFLLLAAGAGVLAGRLGRGMAGNASADGSSTGAGTSPRAEYYPSSGGAVPPPAVDLPGPDATTASYTTRPSAGYGTEQPSAYGTPPAGGVTAAGGAAGAAAYGTGTIGDDAGTAGYDPAAGTAGYNPEGYDAGTTGGFEGSTAAYPETDGGTKAQGDPLADPLDDPDSPEYGGPR
ncbi:hypothetical protein ACIPY3_22395 [Paenarthrobacter sp. NPDC089714]|uniref:hypothetical protein n=1 Tax=Paenarthrobacter sp. NPDC089714 TaxID=3364377 RepID=UPI0038075EED